MPFKVPTFQESVERQVVGDAQHEVMHACQAYSDQDSPQQKACKIHEIMDMLDRQVSEETRRSIMEACGRRCLGASVLEKACRLQREAQDLDDLLSRLNDVHIGGGYLQREGNVIHATYDRCYCGSVSNAREPFSATYCYCSCGWYRQFFETLLDRSVEVELLSSIIQGDERCRFLIRIQ